MTALWKQNLIGYVTATMLVILSAQKSEAQHYHHHHHAGVPYAGGYHSGHHHHSHGVVYGGYGYYPTYVGGYYNGGTSYTPTPVVVQNGVPSNIVPSAVSVGRATEVGTITIVNPTDSGGVVSFTLNNSPYSIKPGQTQTIQNDRLWTVAFGSGGPAGDVRYSLKPAVYKFKVTEGGWNLFQTQEQPKVVDYPPAPVPESEGLTEEPRSVRIPITQP